MMPAPKGNTHAQKHGGEAAVKAIQKGEPFTGLAAEAEENARAEMEAGGVDAMTEKNATRLQAASDLYWNAVLAAAQNNDIEGLDRYISRYGWLAGVTLRALAELRKIHKDRDRGGANVVDVLKSYEAKNEENDTD